jgi:hypothetical protein
MGFQNYWNKLGMIPKKYGDNWWKSSNKMTKKTMTEFKNKY